MRAIGASMGVALTGVVAGATLVAVPQAMGASVTQVPVPQVSDPTLSLSHISAEVIAFQDTSNTLGQNGNLYSAGSLGKAVAAGTSPVVIAQPGFGYEVVYQANDGHLAFAGTVVTTETSNLLAPGTSPSQALLSDDVTDQIVWQGPDHNLWTSAEPTGGTDLGLAMAPKTSPSLIAFADGNNWEAAFQGADGKLYFTGTRYGTNGGGVAMAPGTSPSIAVDSSATDAFWDSWHGANNDLWVAGGGQPATDLGLSMASGTSPSLAEL